MTDSGSKAYAATPAATLEQRIMDCNIPKSEAEHWASKEITALRAEVEALRGALDQAATHLDGFDSTLGDLARAALKGDDHG